jgi:DNA-binding response OmpR family regulator
VTAGAERVETPVISVDFSTWMLNGQRMSRSDHALLQVFVERADQVVTKRELWNAFWGSVPQNGYGRFTSRALEAAISRLRRKGVPLVNIWGVGWLLPADALATIANNADTRTERHADDVSAPLRPTRQT